MVTTTLPTRPLAPAPARSRTGDDVLAVAWAPGAAPPREVRVRPEVLERLRTVPDAAGRPLLGDPAGVPVVVDPALPRHPGFEVRRVPPR
ncbi:hypothetical protein [Geodermatophilus sp. FMUSA9-8]|uniref:hypothetical protein n=1 Tax=Geodermatophilus sp. FMUSA9-8 TaxID=3120155 RepID=UPI00300B8613